nr:translocation/assembly module TamB domain-containing protein [Lysobacter tabacisoli]
MRRTPAPVPAPDPARDARIAELRERRRARVRWLVVRGSLLTGALGVLLVLALYWLLTTVGGRDLLLAQIVARLPANATLTWSRAEGPVSGPMTLTDVRFAMDHLVFTARRVHLDPALRPLLGRRLRLDALHVSGARLALPESDEPFELPRWPDVLPDINPPLGLQADDVRVDGLAITRGGEPLLDIRTLRAGVDARRGRLHVDRLELDSDRGRLSARGDYVPADNYRTDVTARLELPAATGRTRPVLGFVARGDLARMDVAAAGNAPAPTRITLALRGQDDPRWRLRARSEGLDVGFLTGAPAGESPVPMTFAFDADGVGGQADLRGTFAQGELRATVLPSKVRVEDQVLEVAPLALELLDGRATLRGRADFTDPANARFRFAVNARGLTWGGASTTATTPARAANDMPAVTGDADLGVAGTLQSWAAIGQARLARDGQDATLDFNARGNDRRATLRTLKATMPTGTLAGQGTVTWDPALAWTFDARLAGFDPGYFAPDWGGAVSGQLASDGRTRDDGGLEASLTSRDLVGRLRGRPLRGSARVAMHGPARAGANASYDGEVALTLGGSRLDARGRVADVLDIDARFSPVVLGDLLPDASGTLRGTLRLRGPRTAPDVDADLSGSALRYGDYAAETLSLRGRLPWARGSGALALRASGLSAGLPFDTLALDARGAVENLQFDADARGDVGTLALAGSARRSGATWQGALASLQLAPSRGATWRLQQPATWRWDGRSGALSSSCLAASDGGTLCASADWPRRGLEVRGEGLPLALAIPYLPERDDRRPWLLNGEVALDAQVRPVGNAWRGTATLRSAHGGLRNSARARRELLSYDNLTLDATFDPNRLTLQLASALNEDGRLEARIATGWDGYAPLAGEIALNTDELTWMELLSPDIVEPKGRLDGRISLAGTRAQPQLGGQARLTGFTTELPALAIVLEDGDVRLDAQPDGSARITGSVRSGDGVLAVGGALNWRNADAPLLLTLRGDNVLVSDTRDLRAVASPDLQVRYAAGQPITVTGTVRVPSAVIDLERLDQGVSASPDVVVLDPVDPERTADSPLDLDLALVLGDDVRLNGFGLTGALTGQLRVRARPGREMVGNGQLDVEGQYEAYGQDLDITRGQLTWSNSPISDPRLDVRAEREVGDVTAGVDIRGRASAPTATVWSDPATSQSEALSYLTLGRPLSTLTGDESRQLNAASAALSAGGSLLASQIGAAIGLDDAGVSESRALGGSVLGFGKKLSPRLYVGYGVSLLGTGQVLMLKYLLRKGFDIEIESSTVENRASLNWRREK